MKISKFALLALLIVPCTLYVLNSSRVSAQAATGSADQLRDSVKQKVAEQLAEIKKNVAKRGFVGTITAKSDATVTISNLKGLSRSVVVTTDSTIKLLSGKDGTPADLKVGDNILVMGDADSQNVLTAKRLLVIAKPASDNRQAITGIVSATTTSSITLDSKTTVKITSDTKYLGKSTKLSDVKTGSRLVIITSTSGTFSTPTAKRIAIVADASPSASPKP
jgi:hypothetical protein